MKTHEDAPASVSEGGIRRCSCSKSHDVSGDRYFDHTFGESVVSAIRSARQCGFIIRDANEEHSESHKIDKNVRIVTTIEFCLIEKPRYTKWMLLWPILEEKGSVHESSNSLPGLSQPCACPLLIARARNRLRIWKAQMLFPFRSATRHPLSR